jgi:hypothetical protein
MTSPDPSERRISTKLAYCTTLEAVRPSIFYAVS